MFFYIKNNEKQHQKTHDIAQQTTLPTRLPISSRPLDFDLFQQPEQQNLALWCFEMRDSVLPEVKLGDELQLNIIELRKADRLQVCSESLQALITFFEHWQEEHIMANIDYEPVQQAMEKLKQLSADEETRHMAFVREKALRDEASLINDAVKRGEANILTLLLNQRFGELPSWVSQKLSNATSQQIERWSGNVLNADSLEQVFESH